MLSYVCNYCEIVAIRDLTKEEISQFKSVITAGLEEPYVIVSNDGIIGTHWFMSPRNIMSIEKISASLKRRLARFSNWNIHRTLSDKECDDDRAYVRIDEAYERIVEKYAKWCLRANVSPLDLHLGLSKGTATKVNIVKRMDELFQLELRTVTTRTNTNLGSSV